MTKKTRDLNNIYSELSDKYQAKMDDIRKEYENRIDESNRITNEYRDKYEKSLFTTSNSTIKGKKAKNSPIIS